MKKTVSAILLFAAFAAACKKDNGQLPDNPGAALVNTIWGGTYFDYSNPGNNRSYSIQLNSGGKFDWTANNPVTKIGGVWHVKENIITFQFTSGDKNAWSGQIDNDRIIQITEPVPAGFHVNYCVKNP